MQNGFRKEAFGGHNERSPFTPGPSSAVDLTIDVQALGGIVTNRGTSLSNNNIVENKIGLDPNRLQIDGVPDIAVFTGINLPLRGEALSSVPQEPHIRKW